MAYTSLTSEEVESGKPVKTSMMDQIRTNLDDLDSRVSGLAVGGYVGIFNQILRLPEIPIGAAIWGWDTLANSQTQGLGSNWIRPEGSGSWIDGAGTTRNTPDATDRFLRMASTYTSVNVTDLVDDSTAVNGLSLAAIGNHSHTVYGGSGSGSTTRVDYGSAYGTSANNAGQTSGAGGHNHTLSGDSETAPKHIKQNLLFKNANAYGERKLLFKAGFAFTINNAILTQLEHGDNTTSVEIDVKVGNLANLRAGTLTSIFSTKPTIESDGSTDFVEDSGTISDGDVASGEWVELSITSYQTGMSELHIQVSGVS